MGHISKPSPADKQRFEDEFITEALASLSGYMQREGITQAELGRRLDTSRANVCQMLAGRNVTLRSLASACMVIGAEPYFSVLPSKTRKVS